MRLRVLFALCVLVGLVACDSGGGSDAITCETLNFIPSGGNLVGDWRVTEMCITVTSNPLEQKCDPADTSMTLTTGSVDLNTEYRADGTVSTTGTLTLVQDYTATIACLEEYSDTCVANDQYIKSQPDTVSGGCVENAARCTCEREFAQETIESGKLYKAEANKLHYKDTTGGWDGGRDYVVDGSHLIIKVVNDVLTSYTIYSKR